MCIRDRSSCASSLITSTFSPSTVTCAASAGRARLPPRVPAPLPEPTGRPLPRLRYGVPESLASSPGSGVPRFRVLGLPGLLPVPRRLGIVVILGVPSSSSSSSSSSSCPGVAASAGSSASSSIVWSPTSPASSFPSRISSASSPSRTTGVAGVPDVYVQLEQYVCRMLIARTGGSKGNAVLARVAFVAFLERHRGKQQWCTLVLLASVLGLAGCMLRFEKLDGTEDAPSWLRASRLLDLLAKVGKRAIRS